MAVLSGIQLKRRLTKGKPDELLVVTPLLEPAEQLRKDQASIDLRLGFDFALFSPSRYGAIDEFDLEENFSKPEGFVELYKRLYLPFGEKLVIHPHQFILASTLEYLRLPKDLVAYVIGRSTWGRLGLIVATAVGVQPGFTGALTLELRNLGETPLSLYPGQVIAQLFFHSITQPSPGPAGTGQYSGTTDLLPRSLSPEKSHRKLAALAAHANSRRAGATRKRRVR